MAKNYNEIYNSVYVTGNKMDWTNAMIRGNGIPLDIYSVFDTFGNSSHYGNVCRDRKDFFHREDMCPFRSCKWDRVFLFLHSYIKSLSLKIFI